MLGDNLDELNEWAVAIGITQVLRSSAAQNPQIFTASQLHSMVSGRGRDNSMYGQEKFLPGEATLKGGIVCLGLHRKKSLCGRFFFSGSVARVRLFHVSSCLQRFLHERFETLRNGKEWLRTSYWSHFPFNDLFHFCQDYEVSSQSPISLKTSIVFVVLANAAFVLSYLFLIPKKSNHFFCMKQSQEKPSNQRSGSILWLT